ncbi:hypothetical protein [Lysobacter capsici]|uniref:hypothetical protein n=1 Tax=Lysobacter capsici TaxID=435897 RepID=UPI0012FDDDC7|nr:hypothetical protein [Lysobacter capsici]
MEVGKIAVKQAVFELSGKFDRISCRVVRNEWRIETSARCAKSFRLKRIEIAVKNRVYTDGVIDAFHCRNVDRGVCVAFEPLLRGG